MVVALITIFFANGEPAKHFTYEMEHCFSERAYLERILVVDGVERVTVKCKRKAS